MSAAARRGWTLVRQPLLFAFAIGIVVSLAASGRVSVRLVADGALSFAFVPVIEAAAFAVVYRRGPRAMPYATAVDRFFRTNAPWLAIMTAFAALTIVVTPRESGVWAAPPRLLILAAVAVAGIVWSAALDLAFFRDALGRTRAAAVRDTLLFRAIEWPLVTLYFLGFAIRPMVTEWFRG